MGFCGQLDKPNELCSNAKDIERLKNTESKYFEGKLKSIILQ